MTPRLSGCDQTRGSVFHRWFEGDDGNHRTTEERYITKDRHIRGGNREKQLSKLQAHRLTKKNEDLCSGMLVFDGAGGEATWPGEGKWKCRGPWGETLEGGTENGS